MLDGGVIKSQGLTKNIEFDTAERELLAELDMHSSSSPSWEDLQSFASEMREWSIPTIDRYQRIKTVTVLLVCTNALSSNSICI